MRRDSDREPQTVGSYVGAAVFVAVLLLAGRLHAEPAMAVPTGPSNSANGVLPLGPGVSVLPIGPSGGGGGGGGGGCSNSLDFSQACNSQYINVVGL